MDIYAGFMFVVVMAFLVWAFFPKKKTCEEKPVERLYIYKGKHIPYSKLLKAYIKDHPKMKSGKGWVR